MQPANKGRFYHDGRFQTLMDVVHHYSIQFNLQLTPSEQLDLVEYLKSLPEEEEKEKLGTESNFGGRKSRETNDFAAEIALCPQFLVPEK